MRALLGVYGTRGDLQPMLALALGLRAAGHEVTICAPSNFAEWVNRLGLRFEPCRVDVEAFLNEVKLDVWRASRILPQHAREQFASMTELARDADIFIGGGMNAAGQSVAEKWGIPYRFVGFCPVLIPSREHACVAVPWQRLPKWMNALSWRLNDFAWSSIFLATVNEERVKLGLQPIRETWRTALGECVLMASDPAIGPVPADATQPTTQVGAFVMPEAETLAPEIEAFLNAGPPPVYVGFGSMTDPHPDRTSRMLVEAIETAGVRALLSRGWAKLGGHALPPQIQLIGPAPHGKLFPRVAAVVHHGGAGTTHAALRAGAPQIVVPHLLDQHYWANQVWQQGLGPKPFSKTRLTAARLAASLREVTSRPSYAARSRELQSQLITDGVERAVRELEAVVGASQEVALKAAV